jgi:uncharacterized membrane protein YhaH (DUF805 family)
MTFADAIKTCFNKYANFEGTAARSEYWWFVLFLLLGTIVCKIVSEHLVLVFSLATMLPGWAVAARRLHDTDRSGWWQLIWFIPVIGAIVLIVFLVQEGRPNRYGQPVEPKPGSAGEVI